MSQHGTLGALDTLAQIRNQTVAQFGEDKAFEAISVALEAHDTIMNDLVGEFVEFTSDQLRYSGANDSFNAEELDEFGRPAPQKVSAGDNLGFPLRRYGNALQWTRDWLRLRTPAELAAQVNAIMDADKRNIIRALKLAIFSPANYSFRDVFGNNITIPVKRLANADSFPIPVGPDGASFDASSHTHYLGYASASFKASDLSALIATVREHFATGEMVVDINSAEETAVRNYTGFTPYFDSRVIVAADTTRGAAALDVTNVYDRAIGLFDSAEVRVKPWVPAGYMLAHVRGNGALLACRTRDGQSLGALELVADIDSYPLRAQMWRREFGLGVIGRVNGAAAYTGGDTYAAPSL